MFKGQRPRLRFKPENGLQVLVTAQVGLYEPRGDYQLIVEAMEESGAGALAAAYENLKFKLLQEGLLEPGRKKKLPPIPSQIGVITSPSGAAIHDILNVLNRRFPAIPVLIYPVAVQGETAKYEIVQALETANRQQWVDVIILGRGGGSLEDLWAFNEEIVARAIAASEIPVISAVGHEVDVTIADFVADFRAATPSAAAEHAVPHQDEWLNAFSLMERQISRKFQVKLSQLKQQLQWLDKSLQQQHPGQKLQRNAQRLDELEQRINLAMRHKLQVLNQQLALGREKFKPLQLADRIAAYSQLLAFHRQRLERAINVKLAVLRNKQISMGQTLQAVSPLATLERGYSIVKLQKNREIVKSADQVAVGDILINQFAKGSVTTVVEEITER